MLRRDWDKLEKAQTTDQVLHWLTGVCGVWLPIFKTMPAHMLSLEDAKTKQKELTRKRKSNELLPSSTVLTITQ